MTNQPDLVAIASGKGGVGKTWLTVTLAQAMAEAGRTVLVLDGDIGLANVDIQIGLAPSRDIADWVRDACRLADIVQTADAGFDIIPGASGSAVMSGLGPAEIARLIGEFRTLAASYDFGLIDIAAGVDPAQLRLAGAARRCLLTITEDPTSLTDGYAFIKLAQHLKRPPSFEIVVNMAESHASGEKCYGALVQATKNFLGIEPPLAGVIRRDPAVASAIRRQTPILDTAPGAPAASDARMLAAALGKRPARAA